ncbi:hypothetical protein DL96DRAFT_1585905 [Flagelloscypha sp. PMI_526]|nr:hypothetical protein DL96DRAFT_1585905 [Flagelloscypha sp. PMI_526]
MASSLGEASAVSLPPELKLRIFEMCFYEYPDTFKTLSLVSRRTCQYINSIRYFSVTLGYETEVAQFKSWVQTQPPEIVQQGVKAMLINLPNYSLYSEIAELVKACTGVEHLAMWLPGGDPPPFLDSLLLVCLSLPNVRGLSLTNGTESHIRRFLSTGMINVPNSPRIAFMETLHYVDWAIMPNLSLGFFPGVAYTHMQNRWPFLTEHTNRMEQWLSLPSSRGLVLFLDEVNLEEAASSESAILSHEKVVLACTPLNWALEWEKHCLGDEDVVFVAGKRLAGKPKREDRIWRRTSKEV